MSAEIKITPDPIKNVFVVRIGTKKIPLSPADFERLIEASLAAAAEHQDAAVSEGRELVDKNEPIHALEVDRMEPIVDPGAVNVITKMHLGTIKLNFACTRQAALEYCGQVLQAIHAEDTAGPAQLM